WCRETGRGAGEACSSARLNRAVGGRDSPMMMAMIFISIIPASDEKLYLKPTPFLSKNMLNVPGWGACSFYFSQ
ncbi:MAG: hypothetical protein QXZ17_02810, partial [Nitrososphaerota archaeon]